MEDMYSPKTAVANFAHELCSKKKAHLDAFMAMIVQKRGGGLGSGRAVQQEGTPGRVHGHDCAGACRD
eukprot:130127-Chlamydomonas_euryale.AAC.2